MGASTYQYDFQCRRCGKLEYFCRCEDYYKELKKKKLEELRACPFMGGSEATTKESSGDE